MLNQLKTAGIENKLIYLQQRKKNKRASYRRIRISTKMNISKVFKSSMQVIKTRCLGLETTELHPIQSCTFQPIHFRVVHDHHRRRYYHHYRHFMPF